MFPVSPRLETGRFPVSGVASLFEALPTLAEGIASATPLSMEQIGQNFGFILYRTELGEPGEKRSLWLRGVRDRAWVFVDGEAVGAVGRDDASPTLEITVPRTGARLDVLVENMGRTNFGPWVHDRKGILDGVLLDRRYLFGWTIYPLPLDPLPDLGFLPGDGTTAGPTFHEATISLAEPRDAFLNLSDWTKGCCFVNGFHLGRYWRRGPHQSLFVPQPVLLRLVNSSCRR